MNFMFFDLEIAVAANIALRVWNNTFKYSILNFNFYQIFFFQR